MSLNALKSLTESACGGKSCGSAEVSRKSLISLRKCLRGEVPHTPYGMAPYGAAIAMGGFGSTSRAQVPVDWKLLI